MKISHSKGRTKAIATPATLLELARLSWRLSMLTAAVAIGVGTAGANAAVLQPDPNAIQSRACTNTAKHAFSACTYDVNDDKFVTKAACANVIDANDWQACLQEAEADAEDARETCLVEREGRLSLCDRLGQAPYDPVIDPANFVDPAEIGKSVAPNPYLLLVPGRTMIYTDGEELVTVEVTGETREILGVTCASVRDVVTEEGIPIEDTIDWFAQDLAGNVWYFGEISQNFEDGVLVDIDGSWTSGVDRAKPGIVAHAQPVVGTVYRQEFAITEAEDAAEVLSVTASAATPAATCTGDCLQTEDFKATEPDVIEHKYYKPGVGFILEIKPDTGERLELIEIRE